VTGILARNDHFGEAENVLDVPEVRKLGECTLQNGIVDAEELLKDSPLLGLKARKCFVSFRMHAYVALQIRTANRARVEHAVRAKQRNLHVFKAVLAEAIDREQQNVRIKLFCAPPDEAETAHGLIAREGIAA